MVQPGPAAFFGARKRYAGVKVPDFRGMTLRAVLEESAAQGLPVEVAGDGIARAQDPPPGSKLAPNGQVQGSIRAMTLEEVLAGVRVREAIEERFGSADGSGNRI